MRIPFRLLAVFPLLLAASSALVAQEGQRTADHPVLAALTGSWEEEGVLLPAEGAQPLQGRARFVAGPVFGGHWVQQEGSADYGPAKWDYRWMYRLLPGGKVFATYTDSIGQYLRYEGLADAEAGRITLQAKLSDGGTATAQLPLQDDGSLLIQNLNTKPDGTPAVRYQATARKAE